MFSLDVKCRSERCHQTQTHQHLHIYVSNYFLVIWNRCGGIFRTSASRAHKSSTNSAPRQTSNTEKSRYDLFNWPATLWSLKGNLSKVKDTCLVFQYVERVHIGLQHVIFSIIKHVERIDVLTSVSALSISLPAGASPSVELQKPSSSASAAQAFPLPLRPRASLATR